LITDLIMPGMSGSALARILKSRRPAMAVLYVSGYGEPTAEDLIDGAGYLGKPFRDRALARLVAQLLLPGERPARSGTAASS
jgi:FixJ family two-component response regulator